MKLFIAEKPSLAQTVAAGLGGGQKGDGCIEGNGWCVTWCFGHLFELMQPEGYNPEFKAWKMGHLPIIPEQFKLEPKKETKKQLNIIKGLIANASVVVNCSDPDRQGQLLCDDVINQLRWTGPTQRAWLTDLTANGVKKTLSNLEDNSKYEGLRNSADAQRKADWLVGINLTRGATLKAREQGLEGVYSCGRVQTPSLNLVVTRDREIENFKPTNFYTVQGIFSAQNGNYPGAWMVPESIADPEGRCLKPEMAMAVAAKVKGKQGVIYSAKAEKKSESAPLPFSLSALQSFASDKWGMSAQETLDTAQSLYEKHKATTYPRTDCGYLEENKLSEVAATLSAIASADSSFSALVQGANQSAKPRCFNDKKTTAHTGMIPTAKTPNLSAFSEKEKQVYTAIVQRYIAQFYPAYEYTKSEIYTQCEGQMFKSTGKTPIAPGWKVVLGQSNNDQGSEDSATLPMVQKGEGVLCSDAQKVDKQTKKPAHFTEGTLIKAMANVARFVEDSEYKKYLRENDGLGTEATRAGIIETLKNRGFLEVKGKKIISTKDGRGLIDALPKDISDPVMTALWEQALEDIASGKIPIEAFLKKQCDWLTNRISQLDNMKIEGATTPKHVCPTCKKGHLRKRKGKDGPFWGCSNYPDCTASFKDKGGKPVTVVKPKSTPQKTDFKCPDCGSALVKRPGKKPGTNWYGCTGFPKCKSTFPDKAGKPVFE